MTHGLGLRPLATALRAISPAAIITEGFEVFVQLVIEAMATAPFVRAKSPRKSVWTGTGSVTVSAVSYIGSAASNACLAEDNSMRSCGRLGPAMEGTTEPRSSSRYSE